MSGNELKKILQDHGFSGTELAVLLKMNQRSVYEWYRKPKELLNRP